MVALDVPAKIACIRVRLATTRNRTVVTNPIVFGRDMDTEMPSRLRHIRTLIASETRTRVGTAHVLLQRCRTPILTTTIQATRTTPGIVVEIQQMLPKLENRNLLQTQSTTNTSLLVYVDAMVPQSSAPLGRERAQRARIRTSVRMSIRVGLGFTTSPEALPTVPTSESTHAIMNHDNVATHVAR